MALKNKSQQKLWEAMVHPHRRRLLRVLMDLELAVADLRATLKWPQSTTSRHLLYLEKKGFLQAKKDGLWRFYRLRPPKTTLEKALWNALKEDDGEVFLGDLKRARAVLREKGPKGPKKFLSQKKGKKA